MGNSTLILIMGNAIKKAKAKGMAKLAEDPSKFQEQVIAAIEANDDKKVKVFMEVDKQAEYVLDYSALVFNAIPHYDGEGGAVAKLVAAGASAAATNAEGQDAAAMLAAKKDAFGDSFAEAETALSGGAGEAAAEGGDDAAADAGGDDAAAADASGDDAAAADDAAGSASSS